MKRFHANVGARALARRNGGAPALPPLYAFTTFTFTPAGATGRNGPILSAAVSAYTATAPWATNTSYFNMTTQGYQLWTVPVTGTYTVTCAGAGEPSVQYNPQPTGAVVQVNLSLTQGQILQLLVGQSGIRSGTAATGGAGGSFVASGTTPATGVCLVAAGGAAPPLGYNNSVYPSMYGQSTTSGASGTSGSGTGGAAGTNGGGGGVGGFQFNSGGGGFIGNGTSGTGNTNGGGLSFQNGGTGGNGDGTPASVGGFGGGGGSAGGFGGGGGGYSGGGAAGAEAGGGGGNGTPGGGGSFYPGGTFVGATNTGQGYITITAI